ncbi:MAG: SAM-dependent methyltransferase [Bacteroidetes bacterium]|nr:MAG: SAM-dependent methyltransferase [Bacteroidota bacterium]
MAKQIDEKTLAILSRVTVEGNVIFLTCGQLDRKEYLAVNAVLENMGGKWNKKAKGHVYDGDPTDALEQVLLSGEIVPPQKYGYFPTPPELAQHVVALAEVEPGQAVLEPSAGQGGIADHLTGCAVSCVELLPDNAKVLRDKGYHLLHEGTFFDVLPAPEYDRVVMNPPFEKQADIDHVLHAWKFVKPGGRLVAIMASSVAFRENRKTVEFRELLERYGFMEHNPAGSFKASGTMVNTVTVVMDKAA